MKVAIQRLDEAGHVAYVVGGSVRDFLLARDAKDHDIATSATPNELVKLFPGSVTVGKAFGVIKVPVRELTRKEGGEFLEVAAFREDLEYRDHRHPKGIRFSGPEEDARRRDFTVNALFYDPKSNRILDVTNGISDLQAGVVRAIGDPLERFREDALRLLRAVRFTANLGFALDPPTAEAILQRSKLITQVSAERTRDELTLAWKGPRPAYALELLQKLGLLKDVLPEVEALKGVRQIPEYHGEGDIFARTLKVLETLSRLYPSRSATLMWGALLSDIGKPLASHQSQGRNFNGYETLGEEMAVAVGERLKMPRDEIERIRALVGESLRIRDLFKMREATLQRFIREPYFEELLSVHRAQAIASDGNLAAYEFGVTRLEQLKSLPAGNEPKLLDGNDLIQLGLSPGRGFSEILRAVEDLRMEKKLFTKEEALEYVIRNFVK